MGEEIGENSAPATVVARTPVYLMGLSKAVALLFVTTPPRTTLRISPF